MIFRALFLELVHSVLSCSGKHPKGKNFIDTIASNLWIITWKRISFLICDFFRSLVPESGDIFTSLGSMMFIYILCADRETMIFCHFLICGGCLYICHFLIYKGILFLTVIFPFPPRLGCTCFISCYWEIIINSFWISLLWNLVSTWCLLLHFFTLRLLSYKARHRP